MKREIKHQDLQMGLNVRFILCYKQNHFDSERNIIISSTFSYEIVVTSNRQMIPLEFSPTCSCVSLTRYTTSSEWKLFRFDNEFEDNSFQIVQNDVTLCL